MALPGACSTSCQLHLTPFNLQTTKNLVYRLQHRLTNDSRTLTPSQGTLTSVRCSCVRADLRPELRNHTFHPWSLHLPD